MSDSKQRYSDNSHDYVSNDVPKSTLDQERYERSKVREAKWNENWKKQPVNLNEIVNKFTPGVQGYKRGIKYIFENSQWEIRADMVSGYLRIYDKKTKKFIKLDGTFGSKKKLISKFSRERKCKMELILVLDLEGLDYYGYIPETLYAKEGQIESFELSEEDEELLDEDFISPIDKLCDALIDPGEVDYLNAEQCKLMLDWLEQRLKKTVHPRLKEIYHKLIEFANKAIKLNTGIVFDL